MNLNTPNNEPIQSARNSIRKVTKLNTLTVDELKSKLRAKSVSKLVDEISNSNKESKPSSNVQKQRAENHSSSSIQKLKMKSDSTSILNSIKINSNISNKNIMKIEFNDKDMSTKRALASDKRIKLKFNEEKVPEMFKEDEQLSEPVTPIKFVDIINKNFKTNNDNIMRFVSK